MEAYSSEDLAVLTIELPDEIERYKQSGDFAAASAAVDRWLDRLEMAGSESMKKRLFMEKRILEGLRVNFPYTEDEAIAHMRERVPDFERKDLIRLDQEGLAEWIFVDGEKHYIHNLVRNVLQEDIEIVRRISEQKQDHPGCSAAPVETRVGESKGMERWMYPMSAPLETARVPEGTLARSRAANGNRFAAVSGTPLDPTWRMALRAEQDRMCREGISQWRFRLRTSIRLKDEWFYPGIHLRAHLPIPAELYQTSDVKILAHSGGTIHIDRPDSLYRSICLEDILEENREFFVEYEYTVTMKYQDLFARGQVESEQNACFENNKRKERIAVGDTPEDLAPFVQEEYPQIRFTPDLRALAQDIMAQMETSPSCCRRISRPEGEDARTPQSEIGGISRRGQDAPSIERNAAHLDGAMESETALAKAWAIYDYITKNVRYSFMREYYLIPDIPQYCARNLRGDCGVQALLFITLCRICGIPAKWQSGLYLANEEIGLHDWAMFYVEPYGWLYADLSFGGSAWRDELKSDTKEQKERAEARRRFYFGNLDPFRMAANNAFGQSFAVPKRFFPADPYDNQNGELESDERGFCSRDVETKKMLVMAERLSPEKSLCAQRSGGNDPSLNSADIGFEWRSGCADLPFYGNSAAGRAYIESTASQLAGASEQVGDYAWLVPYAEGLLEEAAKCNPGPWVAHSRNVARAARKIVEKWIAHESSLREGRSCSPLDPDRAYISGLLHDIGRRFGVSQLAHVYDGYHYLMDLGFPEFARIALTHSFNLGHLEDYIGKFDISEEKQQELRQLLDGIEFDDYDYLIQYCDSIATADGIVSMEERMNDVKKRYGYYPQEKWKRNLELQEYFETKMHG